MYNKPTYIQNNLVYNQSQRTERSSGLIFDNLIRQQIEDEKERWLTTDEAANYLSISANALRIMVHRAQVKAYKLGHRLRFRKSDLYTAHQLKED